MYLTDTQAIAANNTDDTNAVYAYITDHPGADAGDLAAWAAENLPDNPDTPGQRITNAVASLQQQGKLFDVSGGWIPIP